MIRVECKRDFVSAKEKFGARFFCSAASRHVATHDLRRWPRASD
jgi:hypothetical protein